MRLRPRVNIVTRHWPQRNVFPRVMSPLSKASAASPQAGRCSSAVYDSRITTRAPVPILGASRIGKLFSYNDKSTEQLSLALIITPRVYDASNASECPP